MTAVLTSSEPASVNESVNDSPLATGSAIGRFPRQKAGAPPGNLNGFRHGMYCPRPTQWLSNYGAKQCAVFRHHLEELVAEANGREISVYHAALIQSAVESQRMAIANRELRGLGKVEIKLEARLTLDREYAAHLDRRDRKLKELGLDPRDHRPADDHRKRGPNAHLYDPPYLPPDVPAVAADAPAAEPSPLPAGPPSLEFHL
jgi:hypothetical protein